MYFNRVYLKVLSNLMLKIKRFMKYFHRDREI